MQDERLLEIFRPFFKKRLTALSAADSRFAYYTSAATGMNILKGGYLWMRSAACMNDYKEIDYGIEMLNHAVYSDAARRERIKRLGLALGWSGDVLPRLLGDLTKNEQSLITHTYLACVSEHGEEEAGRGRLSMWRAYGRKTGVAFVLKASALLRRGETLPLEISPVEYPDYRRFSAAIDFLLAHIERSAEELKGEDSERTLHYFLRSLMSTLFSLKHPGFDEEKEWRLIYRENIGALPHEVVSVDGVPQIVYKLPLKVPKSERRTGLPLEDALDYIIIGPSQFSEVIRVAFVKLLGELGLSQPEKRVTVSNIPLREQR